jgi:hypothetical protein
MLSRKLAIMIAALSVFIMSDVAFAAGWTGLRTSGAGTNGWQPVICANGAGWQSCELPVNITLNTNPTSLVANGQSATVTASVTDYYGVPIAGNLINWSTTDGTISANQTATNASGTTAITLTSSHTLGGTAVTASTAENDGSAAIWEPFVDSFVAYPSTYTGWVAYGAVYSCTAWSPDPSTVNSGTWFTQTASCWQNYYRYRQDRQQSIVTGAVTNVGGQVAEYTSGVVGVSQAAVGTKVTTPPPPTITSFTQAGEYANKMLPNTISFDHGMGGSDWSPYFMGAYWGNLFTWSAIGGTYYELVDHGGVVMYAGSGTSTNLRLRSIQTPFGTGWHTVTWTLRAYNGASMSTTAITMSVLDQYDNGGGGG